ncbi:MAG: hypothetical protein HEEMFOPI_00367 [Holosporales bacterium]
MNLKIKLRYVFKMWIASTPLMMASEGSIGGLSLSSSSLLFELQRLEQEQGLQSPIKKSPNIPQYEELSPEQLGLALSPYLNCYQKKCLLDVVGLRLEDPAYLLANFSILFALLSDEKEAVIPVLKRLIKAHPITVFDQKENNSPWLSDQIRGIKVLYDTDKTFHFENAQTIALDAMQCNDDWICSLGMHLLISLYRSGYDDLSPFFLRIKDVCHTLEGRGNDVLVSVCDLLTEIFKNNKNLEFKEHLIKDEKICFKIRRQLNNSTVEPFLVR